MKKRVISLCLVLIMLTSVLTAAALAGDGAKIHKGSKSVIDATNQNDAYVTVNYIEPTDKKLKVTVQLGETRYTYDLNGEGSPEVYSLQMGDGKYTVRVLECVSPSENKYAVVQAVELDVKYNSPFSPFLIPIQNINYSTASPAIQKAAELSASAATDLEKVSAVYGYIVNNISYDKDLASKITSGQITSYLPDVDNIYINSRGICYDYSSLMAAMLRSIGIPTKLITGYVGQDQVYHAWNEVYINGTGWITVKSSVFFPGESYERLDPTFAAGNSSGTLTGFIGNGSNYIKKLEY